MTVALRMLAAQSAAVNRRTREPSSIRRHGWAHSGERRSSAFRGQNHARTMRTRRARIFVRFATLAATIDSSFRRRLR